MTASPELSPEDELRLNVMLAQKPQALRIDESSMTVIALTDKGEARVDLSPNCNDTTYLRRVKAMLSAHVMGSPGGYPVYLERWTRMGQTRSTNLQQLLLLGESEAIVAVAHASGLTEDLARRAWWAMPDAANARVMLNSRRVAESEIGRELAQFLLEFLPFEEQAGNMLESVRLVLQPGLIDDTQRRQLWQRAQAKRNLLVGFLHTLPDELPLEAAEHPAKTRHAQLFDSAAGALSPSMVSLARVFSAPGQAFVQTCELALVKLSDQDVAVSLLAAISNYFRDARLLETDYRDVDALEAAVSALEPEPPAELESYLRSTWFLSAISVELLNPIFARTDAIGSGMRRKIKPVTDRIGHHLDVLRC